MKFFELCFFCLYDFDEVAHSTPTMSGVSPEVSFTPGWEPIS